MTAQRMTVKSGRFELAGKPFFLFSGEIHYFRIPVKFWKKHLEMAKKAGLNAVSFYVPWMWHEFKEGEFDFDGRTHPQRNLIGFLDLVRKTGLYASARVGPVSNAELAGEGIPEWLLKNYPQVFIQRSGVNHLPHAILLSYLDPAFQSFVEKWYDQLLPIVSKRQIHREGNIIFVQLCNEVGMIHWLHKASNPAPFATDLFREFLSEKYGAVSKMNQAWRSSFASFEDVEQPAGEPDEKTVSMYFDWALFYRRYYALYFRTLSLRAEKHGIQVPLSANIPQFYDYDVRGRGVFSPMTTSLFRDFSLLTPKTVLGGAYQMRRLDFENFHDVSVTSECVRSAADPEAPIICAELQTGIMRDRPRLYPPDVDLNLKTSAAHGLNGLNCYMFSSGENLPGMGCLGTAHEWQAPVTLAGGKREHFKAVADWGKFIKKFGPALAETQKVTDTSLGLYLPYFAAEYFSGPWAARLERSRHSHFFDGLARLVQLANVNFSVTDLLKETGESLKNRESLCAFSLDWMDAATQELLAAYVRGGGKLLIGPRLPTLDLSGMSCKILVESLNLSCRAQFDKEMVSWGKVQFVPDFPIQTFPGAEGVLAKTLSGSPCAVQGKMGRGAWLAYGFGLFHNYDYSVEMVRGWLESLGVRSSVSADPWDLQGALRWNRDHGFLFVFNYHDVDRSGRVTVHPAWKKARPWTKKIFLERRSAAVIPLKLRGNIIAEVM